MKQRGLLSALSFFLVMILFGAMSPGADGPATRPEQAGPGGPARMLENTRKTLDSMNLSDEQKAKVAAILDKAIEQAKDLQQKTEALQTDVRQQLSGVLEPEQLKELGQKMMANRPGGGPMPLLQALQQALPQLDLTADQQQQLKDLRDDIRQRLMDIRDKATNGQDMREQIGQIRDDLRDKLNQILTPEQQQALRELMQPEMQGGGGQGPEKPASRPADK